MDKKEHLHTVVSSLVNDDSDTAKDALSQYLQSRASEMINGTPSAPTDSSVTEGTKFAYDVFKDGKKIDTVFQTSDEDVADVKKSLVDHDGYDGDIVVKKRK